MKVLHINTYDSFGGAEKIAYTLYTYQTAAVLVVKEKLKYTDDPNIIEFPQWFLDKVLLITNKVLWKFNLRKGVKTYFQANEELHLTYEKLSQLKAYQEADIIHLHNIHGNFFDLGALKRIGQEKKIVWTLHDMWAFTGGDAYLSEEFLTSTEKYLQQTASSDYPLHSPALDRRNYFLNLKKKLYSEIAQNLMFVPVSGWLEHLLRNSFVFHTAMQVQTIYNGIDIERFKDFKIRNWKTPRVLFFNSASPFKGSDLFRSCLIDLPVDFDLTVVGNKLPQEGAFKVTYVERVNEEGSLTKLFNTVDILVFPSLFEAFGLLPAEAMLCGVLVVASDAGGLKELVFDGVTGLQFKKGQQDDLKTKMQLAVQEVKKPTGIAENGKNYVLEHFPVAHMLLNYEHLYERMTKQL